MLRPELPNQLTVQTQAIQRSTQEVEYGQESE
jgi:hypothetical protein